TRAGIILGTAAYMAPEQARGKSVDKRADIWAFGCVVYEMLTGRRPFAGDDASMTLAAVMLKDPDWSALPATTPAAVTGCLRRCLEKDPRNRLRDIGDVRLALAGAFESGPPPASAAPASRSTFGLYTALAAGALAGIVVTGAAAWWVTPRAPAA